MAIRSKGVSLSTATNWLANYIVGQLTPVLQELIVGQCILYSAGFCIISAGVVIVFYPETKGIELEDIDNCSHMADWDLKMNEYALVGIRDDADDDIDDMDYERTML